jgi:hypothetical protein
MKALNLKVPRESADYATCSDYVIGKISAIIKNAIDSRDNRIFIHTNLKRGLPLENINKVAGPFVEAWALEKFENVAEDPNNSYQLVNVQAGKRLDPFDIILQFKRKRNPDQYLCQCRCEGNGGGYQDLWTQSKYNFLCSD